MTDLVITQTELLESGITGFRLPEARTGDGYSGLRRGKVPPLKPGTLRTLRRYGVFDALKTDPALVPKVVKNQRGEARPMLSWRRPVRKGETLLYGSGDVAICRWAAWALREGLTLTTVITVLRGFGVSALFSARYVDHELALSGTVPAVLTPAEFDAIARECPLAAARTHRFPMSWLGMLGRGGGIQTMREIRDEHPTIWRWRELEPAIAAQQSPSREATL